MRYKAVVLTAYLPGACLPLLHRAVEIDGGLTANPPLFPLLHKCRARDVMVVLLHPQPRTQVPTSAGDIWHRLTAMGFSSTFYTELQGVTLAKREAERSWFSFGRLERRLRQLNMHVIESQELMSQLSIHRKMNAHPAFLNRLHDEGRMRAESWLEKNFQQLGVRSSFRLARLFS